MKLALFTFATYIYGVAVGTVMSRFTPTVAFVAVAVSGAGYLVVCLIITNDWKVSKEKA